jgi:hypothetical protein
MCDFSEEEYAEYLLWCERAIVAKSVRAVARPAEVVPAISTRTIRVEADAPA